MNKAYLGSTLESFFEEKGNLDQVRLLARKKMIAEMIAEVMGVQDVSIAEMSRRMHTSRAVVHRILNPEETGLTLETLDRAAHVLGHELEFRIVPANQSRKVLASRQAFRESPGAEKRGPRRTPAPKARLADKAPKRLAR